MLFYREVGAVSISLPHGNELSIFGKLDCYLHLQWQQCIFTMLLDQLQSYTQYTFQLVIPAHAPIILSDIRRNKFEEYIRLTELQAAREENHDKNTY